MANYEKQNRMLTIFKALANSNRIKILLMINEAQENSMNVNEIFDQLDVSQPTISEHLKLMRTNKILRAKQDGQNMYYSISEPLIFEFLKHMK